LIRILPGVTGGCRACGQNEREFINNGLEFIADAKADKAAKDFPRRAVTKAQGLVDGGSQVGKG
jgi:hypothetical protein